MADIERSSELQGLRKVHRGQQVTPEVVKSSVFSCKNLHIMLSLITVYKHTTSRSNTEKSIPGIEQEYRNEFEL